MKKYYWQRKNATRKPAKSRKKSKVVAYNPENDYTLEERILREFDMNMKYGPCLGLTRLKRWERAHKMGLNPPEQITCLLQNDKVRSECLWYKLK